MKALLPTKETVDNEPISLSRNTTPDDPSIRVWRYMDFTKFVSMLETKSLYFARSVHLGDPFEGAYPKANFNVIKEISDQLSSLPDDAILEEGARETVKFHAEIRRFIDKYTKHCFVNCWHVNEQESAAMWKLYLSSNEGIAIQSTYRRLTDSLPRGRTISDDPESFMYVRFMNYIDYECDQIPPGWPLNFMFHKRKSFEHERELRAVFVKDLRMDLSDKLAVDPDLKPGFGVTVDLGLLIERVYVSPTAPLWFAELVESVAKKYDLRSPVVRSTLNDRPMY